MDLEQVNDVATTGLMTGPDPRQQQRVWEPGIVQSRLAYLYSEGDRTLCWTCLS
jgi:hypothetical protein